MLNSICIYRVLCQSDAGCQFYKFYSSMEGKPAQCFFFETCGRTVSVVVIILIIPDNVVSGIPTRILIPRDTLQLKQNALEEFSVGNGTELSFFSPPPSYLKGTVSRDGDWDEPMDVKTGSPYLADFATTRHLICRLWHFAQWWADRWHIADVTVQYAKGHCPICHSQQILVYFFNVTFAICQLSPKPLREVPRIANGLDAES
jgi:hypothetical protein